MNWAASGFTHGFAQAAKRVRFTPHDGPSYANGAD